MQQSKPLVLTHFEKRLTKNFELKKILKEIIRLLHAQYTTKSYSANNVNKIISKYVQSNMKNSLEKYEIGQIWKQIEAYIWQLSTIPKIVVQMLYKQKFRPSEKSVIDFFQYLLKIYRTFINEGQKVTKYCRVFSELIDGQILDYLEFVCQQICQKFSYGRKKIKKQTKYLEQLIKESQMINFYLLYNLILEISSFCFKKIINELESTFFKNSEFETSEKFAHFIISKHEILDFVITKSNKYKKKKYEIGVILDRIKETDKIKWRNAIRQDGQTGLIIQFENPKQNQQNESILLKLDKQGKVRVVNVNSLTMKWKVSQKVQKNYEIMQAVKSKSTLAQKLRDSPTEFKKVQFVDHFSTLGGTLGRCLADIKQYDSVGSFMFDLSKKSVIGGSYNYLVSSIPLVGVMLVTGGFTYSFYEIFSNHTSSRRRKMQILGHLSLNTASSIGSGVLGAVVGQSLIPVPFVGAFVGGLVGGFIGQIGGKTISQTIQSKRFFNIAKELEHTIEKGGYWKVNQQTKSILGLNKNNFSKTIPKQINQNQKAQQIWFTMIAFTILCFQESKKRVKFIEEKTSIIKKRQSDKKKSHLLKEMKNEMDFKAHKNLDLIIRYFEENQVKLINVFKELEDIIKSLFKDIN